MINRSALFSDETVDYKSPYQPQPGDTVTLRIRTLKNDMDRVSVVIDGRTCRMTRAHSGEVFDLYEYRFTCGEEKVSYYFKLVSGEETVLYNRLGAVEKSEPKYRFSFVPGFMVPEWALGTVYYQIFTDRFCNGDETNDVGDNEYFYAGRHVKHIADWNQSPASYDVANFYGGDLQGVKQKLDYLQALGVETIYFNPLFVSPSNHKYDTQDYDHIDPHFAVIEEDLTHPMKDWEQHNGYAPAYIRRVTSQKNLEKSNAFFAELVADIHKRGMRVVIDGVFNHCGSFNKWMDKEGIYLNKEGFEKGAFQSLESPYRSYFAFSHGRDNFQYEGWWGHNTLPKLNYEDSEELVDYILSTGKKWVSAPYNADGWRLDVAADLGHSLDYNHAFWKRFRKSVREANPNAVILAEHYGSPAPWLEGGEWDTVMNYDAFMEPVTWFLTGMEKHSDAFDAAKLLDGDLFFRSMKQNMAIFSRPSLDAAMNELSNHDHSRFLTRTNRHVGRLKTAGAGAAMEGINVRVMKLGVLMQMTWPGAPAVYYGDEAGQVGWTDPDSRRTYPWGHENKELLDFHREAIRLHHVVACLRMGSVKPLASGHGYVAYARFDARGQAIVVVNASNEPRVLSLPVWESGLPRKCEVRRILSTTEKASAEPVAVVDGVLVVTIPAETGCVYTWGQGLNG